MFKIELLNKFIPNNYIKFAEICQVNLIFFSQFFVEKSLKSGMVKNKRKKAFLLKIKP